MMHHELHCDTQCQCFASHQYIASDIHEKKTRSSYYPCPFLRPRSISAFQTSSFFPKAWVLEWRSTECSNFSKKRRVRLSCISKTHPTGKWITTATKASVNTQSMHKINIFPLGYEQWSTWKTTTSIHKLWAEMSLYFSSLISSTCNRNHYFVICSKGTWTGFTVYV